jgi:hypothetical protein
MKVILCLLMFLVPFCIEAQSRYSFSIDLIGAHLERTETTIFIPFNFKFALKSSEEGFFFELQPGVILNGLIFHTDFQVGLQNEAIFLKGGGLYFFNVTSGSMFSSSVETALLPGISVGVFAAKNFFIEGSFNPVFLAFGVGYNL